MHQSHAESYIEWNTQNRDRVPPSREPTVRSYGGWIRASRKTRRPEGRGCPESSHADTICHGRLTSPAGIRPQSIKRPGSSLTPFPNYPPATHRADSKPSSFGVAGGCHGTHSNTIVLAAWCCLYSLLKWDAPAIAERIRWYVKES